MLSLSGVAPAATSLLPAYDDTTALGPRQAQGAIIYSHGRSLMGEDSLSPSPAYLKYLAKAGWDAFRFNRPSAEDTLPASSRDLASRAEALKTQGYRRVIVAGQSFGAFLSIMAAADSDAIDGVIATAPAAFGNRQDSGGSWRLNASELFRDLSRLHHARVLLAFFQDDIYDPGGRAETAAALLAETGSFGVVIDRPSGFKGHLAAAGPKFAARFGTCLKRFVEAAPEGDACGGMGVNSF